MKKLYSFLTLLILINLQIPAQTDYPVHNAAKQGDKLQILKYIAQGYNINKTDLYGKTPLCYAAEFNHPEIIQVLIYNGADPNKKTSFTKYTPLHFAAENNFLESVQILINNGAELNPKAGDYELTPLYLAGIKEFYKIVVLLYEKGADINAKGQYGLTLMHRAVLEENMEMLRFLILQGANPNIEAAGGLRPLHLTADNAGIKILLDRNGAEADMSQEKKNEILYKTSEKGYLPLVEKLIEKGFNVNGRFDGKPVLYGALEKRKWKTAHLLLDNGASPSYPPEVSKSAVYQASTADIKDLSLIIKILKKNGDPNRKTSFGETPLYAAAKIGDEKLSEILLEFGAYHSPQNRYKETPIHEFSKRGCVTGIKLLLEAGADIQSKDIKGLTPIHYAAYDNRIEAIKYLLKEGSSIHSRDDMYRTPLHFLCSNPEAEPKTVNYILSNGGKIDSEDENGKTPLHYAVKYQNNELVKTLLNNEADINHTDEMGITPFLESSKTLNRSILEFLYDSGADIYKSDNELKNALHYSVLGISEKEINNRIHYIEEIKGAETAEFLIEIGIDKNKQDSEGLTPLHYAAETGSLKLIEVFLKFGADPGLETHKGFKPLDIAAKNGNIDAMNIFFHRNKELDPSTECLTTLYAACSNNRVQTAEYLMEIGVDPNIEIRGNYALHIAAENNNTYLAKILLSYRAEIEQKNKYGKTPLDIAAEYGHFQMTKFLVDNGADVSEYNEGTGFLIGLATRIDSEEIARKIINHKKYGSGSNIPGIIIAVLSKDKEGLKMLLEKGVSINETFNSAAIEKTSQFGTAFTTPIKFTCRLGYSEMLETMLDNWKGVLSKSELRDLLFSAVSYGYSDIIEMLLNKGADISSKDLYGRTALFYNKGFEYNPGGLLKGQIIKRSSPVEVAELLISYGCDIYHTDNEGNNLLHFAVMYGLGSLIEFYYNKGFDVNSKNNQGLTPLHHASIKYYTNSKESAEYLLRHEALVNSVDFEGKTPLHFAAAGNDIDVIGLLIDYGGEINVQDTLGRTPLHYASEGYDSSVDLLLKSGANPNYKDKQDKTPLITAVENGYPDCVKLLIAGGSIVDDSDSGGNTGLHIACGKLTDNILSTRIRTKSYYKSEINYNCLYEFSTSEDYYLEVVKILLKSGAALEVRNAQGRTPLHLAAIGGFTEAVKLLLEKGSDTGVEDNLGLEPIDYAEKSGNKIIIDLLE